ncbi:hypothetical protein EMCRGX_G016252 [Ephydatia muelleri]
MYVSNSQVVSQRSWWTPSGLVDLFWAVVSFLYLFAKTLDSEEAQTRNGLEGLEEVGEDVLLAHLQWLADEVKECLS